MMSVVGMEEERVNVEMRGHQRPPYKLSVHSACRLDDPERNPNSLCRHSRFHVSSEACENCLVSCDRRSQLTGICD